MNYQEIAQIRQQQRMQSTGSQMLGYFFGLLAIFFSKHRLEKDLEDYEYLVKNCPNQNWEFVHLIEFVFPDNSTAIGNVWAFQEVTESNFWKQAAIQRFNVDDCDFIGSNAYYVRYLSYPEAKQLLGKSGEFEENSIIEEDSDSVIENNRSDFDLKLDEAITKVTTFIGSSRVYQSPYDTGYGGMDHYNQANFIAKQNARSRRKENRALVPYAEVLQAVKASANIDELWNALINGCNFFLDEECCPETGGLDWRIVYQKAKLKDDLYKCMDYTKTCRAWETVYKIFWI